VALPNKIESNELQSFHERKVIVENDAVTLWYYPSRLIVHHQMTKAPTSEQFRELLTKGADLVERHHAPKWLSDDRGNTVLREPDEQWAHSVWLQVLGDRASACGDRKAQHETARSGPRAQRHHQSRRDVAPGGVRLARLVVMLES
jgi:hypothetical protein